jgi:hypothetical protein
MPVSNPAQLTSVVAIFGGPGNLRSYLAGGTYVPPGTTGVNGAVPSSGSLPLSKLAGTVNFTPGTVTYTSSSGVFTVPSGTTTLVIEIVGGAGAGGYGTNDSFQDYGGGGGGGGAKSITSVAASGGGQSLSWLVGRGGNYVDGLYGVASTVSGVLITTMTAGGGTPGSSNYPTASGGPGGTATGGNVSNSTGDAGNQGDIANPGLGGSNYSQGGTGGYGASVQGDPGAGGYVKFTYT